MNLRNAVSTWPEQLCDPSGMRLLKPRSSGFTMVMDKGLGMRAFEDMIATAGEHLDVVKLGFGTSVLVPLSLVKMKTHLARQHGIAIMPGGTLLEVAYLKGMVTDYFHMMREMGFSAVEVSDGTISMSRTERSRLIRLAKEQGFEVCTEYGKKLSGSRFDVEQLEETLLYDLDCGASWMTLEGRESGAGVGIYDRNGECDHMMVEAILQHIVQKDRLLWEAPRKDQQLFILKIAGVNASIGNVSPEDILSLEALRRGLRSDTVLEHHVFNYEI
ncbi:phosphosulfolactate synthase [Paenibacillus marinisediminis]